MRKQGPFKPQQRQVVGITDVAELGCGASFAEGRPGFLTRSEHLSHAVKSLGTGGGGGDALEVQLAGGLG